MSCSFSATLDCNNKPLWFFFFSTWKHLWYIFKEREAKTSRWWIMRNKDRRVFSGVRTEIFHLLQTKLSPSAGWTAPLVCTRRRSPASRCWWRWSERWPRPPAKENALFIHQEFMEESLRLWMFYLCTTLIKKNHPLFSLSDISAAALHDLRLKKVSDYLQFLP